MIRQAPDDRIDAWLRARGASGALVGLGLEGLVREWEATVASIAAGYRLTWDDYVNDLDLRQIVEELLSAEPDTRGPLLRRLRAADATLREATLPSATCVWGEDVAARHRWNPRRSWWYWAVPRRAGRDLVDDLAARGVTPSPAVIDASA